MLTGWQQIARCSFPDGASAAYAADQGSNASFQQIYIGAGVMEIFETGDVMFQKLRNNVRDTNVKNLATAVGHMCFPAGSEGCEPLVRSPS